MNSLDLVRTDEFVKNCVMPYAALWEAQREMPRELFVDAASHGLTGLITPVDSGGQGLGVADLAKVLRQVAAADMACAFSLVVHNNLAAAIARSENNFLKDSVLPEMLSGEKVGAFLLTEPQGGSDAAAINTYAKLEADGYVVNGEKAWVSNGIYADVLSVYAQTDAGMLAVVIPADTAGVKRTDQYSLLGGHALGTSGFVFENVRVPLEYVLVEPGNGLRAALSGIDIARITVAAMCCGMLDACLSYAIDFAGGRQFKGRAITEWQGIQWRLADVATDLAAASALTSEAARIYDGGEPSAEDKEPSAEDKEPSAEDKEPSAEGKEPSAESGEPSAENKEPSAENKEPSAKESSTGIKESSTVIAAEAKKFATTVAVRRIADCMQVMGAPGLSQEHPVARHFACAKMAEYLDGTTEIQNIVIARSLFDKTTR